jgi:putative DNA primase/helicase
MQKNNSNGSTGLPAENISKIQGALSYVDPNPRKDWVAVGQALHSELGDGGFTIWDKWSQGGDSYNTRDARDVWRSFKGATSRMAASRQW